MLNRNSFWLGACLWLTCGAFAGAQITVEDFKSTTTSGFDLQWTAPATTVGGGTTVFSSNNEIGRLSNDSNASVVAGLSQFANAISWDTTAQRYMQIMVPNLGFGYRSKVSIFTSADPGVEKFPHDLYLAIPGQGPRPQTLDLNAVLPAGPQDIIVRLEIINEGYGPAGQTSVNVDWIKLGMLTDDASATAPGFVGPTDGALTANPPTFQWSAPAGYAGNTYTVTYSQDPLFSDASTVTVLDGVTGTSYTPPAPLADGTWYWTVSATSASGMSGIFMEKGLTGGDSRDPNSHLFYSLQIGQFPITVEDFKSTSNGGFDLDWTAPATTVGSGTTVFSSNNEVGRLSNDGNDAVVAGLSQFANAIPWDTGGQRYMQIMVPNLGYGYRSKVSVFSSADPGVEKFPHNLYLEIPGQGPRPQTLDLNAVLPAGVQDIIVRMEIINEGYGPAGQTNVNVDWIKLGMLNNDAPATAPTFVGPTDGAITANPPTLQWNAPAGYAGNTYTVTYSQDPLFSDATTVTVLDGVTGTSYTPPAPLAIGTWYWTVSATSDSGMSGIFMEKGLTGGDSRDPNSHLFFSFELDQLPVTLSSFTME